ncbi:hypothetical protein, partial [Limnohabitans sp. Rim28]|uniref:hypothetical protein n=1 Tax=Limnohabitans sp. Rim28 TaxID=1100720 RepID=UPI001EDCC901
MTTLPDLSRRKATFVALWSMALSACGGGGSSEAGNSKEFKLKVVPALGGFTNGAEISVFEALSGRLLGQAPSVTIVVRSLEETNSIHRGDGKDGTHASLWPAI